MDDTRPRLTLGEAAKASGVSKPTVKARLERAGMPLAEYAAAGSGGSWSVPVDDLIAAGVPVGSRKAAQPSGLTHRVAGLEAARKGEVDVLQAELRAARELAEERATHLADLRAQLAHLQGLTAVLQAELEAARVERSGRRGLPWGRGNRGRTAD